MCAADIVEYILIGLIENGSAEELMGLFSVTICGYWCQKGESNDGEYGQSKYRKYD